MSGVRDDRSAGSRSEDCSMSSEYYQNGIASVTGEPLSDNVPSSTGSHSSVVSRHGHIALSQSENTSKNGETSCSSMTLPDTCAAESYVDHLSETTMSSITKPLQHNDHVISPQYEHEVSHNLHPIKLLGGTHLLQLHEGADSQRNASSCNSNHQTFHDFHQVTSCSPLTEPMDSHYISTSDSRRDALSDSDYGVVSSVQEQSTNERQVAHDALTRSHASGGSSKLLKLHSSLTLPETFQYSPGRQQAGSNDILNLRKKINTLNMEKLDIAASLNREILVLRANMVSLQSDVEQQKETNEKLEFDILQLNRQSQQDAHNSAMIIDQNQSLIKRLQDELHTTQQAAAEEALRFQQQTEDLKLVLSKTQDSIRCLTNEKHEMTNLNTRLLRDSHSLTEQIEALTNQLLESRADSMRISFEADELRSRCAALASANSDLKNQVNAQNESLLAQKTEFSNQTSSYQLRLNELSSQLDEEKLHSNDLLSLVERLTTEVKQQKQSLEQESTERRLAVAAHELLRSEYASSKDTLIRAHADTESRLKQAELLEKEHCFEIQNLKEKISSMRDYITNIGEQIREIYMNPENAATWSVLDGWQTSSTLPFCDLGEEICDASEILKPLRTMMNNLQIKCDSQSAEVSKMQALYSALKAEAIEYQATIKSKTIEHESVQELLIQKEQEMDHIKQNLGDLHSKITYLQESLLQTKTAHQVLQDCCDQLKKQNEELSEQLANQKSELSDQLVRQRTELSDQLIRQKQSNEQSEREKTNFLCELLKCMKNTAPFKSPDGLMDKHSTDIRSDYDEVSWSAIAHVVMERCHQLLNDIESLHRKFINITDSANQRNSHHEYLKQQQEQELSTLREALESNRVQWKEERHAMEVHYSTLFAENQARQLKSQLQANEAWNRLAEADEKTAQLQDEVADLSSQLSTLQSHNRCMLCAFVLVMSAHYPLTRHYAQLVAQKNLLKAQLDRYEECELQLRSLFSTLTVIGDDAEATNVAVSRSSSRRFRTTVLAILAAQRLAKASFSTLSTTKGKKSHLHSKAFDSCQATALSLSNSDVISTVLSCTAELVDSMHRTLQGDFDMSVVSIDKSCQQCYRSLFHKLEPVLDCAYLSQRSPQGSADSRCLISGWLAGLPELPAYHKTPSQLRERTSKQPRQLTQSRSREQAQSLSHEQTQSLSRKRIPLQLSIGLLEQYIISLVDKLRAGESERASLRERLKQANSALHRAGKYKVTCESLELERKKLVEQMETMVPSQRYQDTVSQLKQAVHLECVSQNALAHQSSQLKDLSERLESEIANHKLLTEQSYQASAEELNQKLELVEQLSAQVSSLEEERRLLHENIFSAEKALNAASHRREQLLNYIQTISYAFNRCSCVNGKSDARNILLSPQLLPSEPPSNDLLSVQALVKSFVDALICQQDAITRIEVRESGAEQRLSRSLSAISQTVPLRPSRGTSLRSHPRDMSGNLRNKDSGLTEVVHLKM